MGTVAEGPLHGIRRTWEAKETIDAGVAKTHFYLQTGGDTRTTTALRTLMERPRGNEVPPQVPED